MCFSVWSKIFYIIHLYDKENIRPVSVINAAAQLIYMFYASFGRGIRKKDNSVLLKGNALYLYKNFILFCLKVVIKTAVSVGFFSFHHR